MSLYYLMPFTGLLTPFITQVTPDEDSATCRSTASIRVIYSGRKLMEATMLSCPAVLASSSMSIMRPPPLSTACSYSCIALMQQVSPVTLSLIWVISCCRRSCANSWSDLFCTIWESAPYML
mgnify:CR=1 FL=1